MLPSENTWSVLGMCRLALKLRLLGGQHGAMERDLEGWEGQAGFVSQGAGHTVAASSPGYV
jgi:hypothetical protein